LLHSVCQNVDEFPSKAFTARPSSAEVSWLSVYNKLQEVVGKTISEVEGATVSVTIFDVPLLVAVMVTLVEAVTAKVATANVLLVLPADIVTDAGTVATEALLLLSVTTAPPVGAAPVKVAVPVELAPPATEVGFKLTVLSVLGAATVRLAVFDVPL
jgi:hypothetical protein